MKPKQKDFDKLGYDLTNTPPALEDRRLDLIRAFMDKFHIPRKKRSKRKPVPTVDAFDGKRTFNERGE